MQKNVKHQFTFQQSPEVVWEYLTDAELLGQWLMPNDIKAVVGHKFQFKTKPKINFGFDGTVYCEVMEVVHHKRLVYTWKGGLSKEKPLLDTIVIWTLTPTAEGTVLQLEHNGFKGMKNYLPYFIMNNGWAKIGKRLFTKMALV